MGSRSVMFAAIMIVTALVGAALAAPTSAITFEDYVAVSSIGPAYGPSLSWSGSGPNAIDIDPAGNVYVSNPYGFTKFDESGAFMCGYSGDQFGGYCYGVAVSDDGVVVLTEGGMDRVVTLLPVSGGLDATAYTFGVAYGASGTGDGQFDWPKGVACDGDYVYVCEQYNNRIQKLLLDPATGALSHVARFGRNGGDGTPGSGDGEFNSPTGVAVDGRGHIYVAQTTLVQELTTDGVFVSKFGVFGQPDAEFYLRNALDVDVDGAGDLYVTDCGAADETNWVNKFRKVDGVWHRVTRFGGWGTAADQFRWIWGVSAAPDGTTFVTDTGNNMIKRFARDTVAPAPWALGIPSGWTNQDVTVEMGGNDPVFPFQYTSGFDRVEYSLASPPLWIAYTVPFTVDNEGFNLLSLRAIDKAGNESSPGMLAVKIDKTAPVTTWSGVPSSWSKESVACTLTPEDPAPAPAVSTSGVASTTYRLLGAAQWGTYAAPIDVSAEGETTFEVRSEDNAGNVETPKTVTVRVDKTAPVTAVSGVPSGWTNDTVSASFQASDAHSGSAATYHKLGGGDTWSPGASVQISDEGETQLSWYSEDNVGNAETPKTATVRVDKTAPVTAVTGVPVAWSRSVKVTLEAVDGLAGVAAVQYRLQGEATWNSYLAPFAPEQGLRIYEFRSIDAAGNDETPGSVTVKYDSGKPAPKARSDRSVRRGQTVRLPYRVNDVCPQTKVSIRIYRGSRLVKTLSVGSRPSNRNLTYSYRCRLARGTYTWKVYAKDLAGNAQAKPGVRRLKVK